MADPETEARAQADHPEDVLILSDPTSEPDAGIPDVAPVKETLRWQSSGLGGLLAGGVIAAALGFGLARFAVPEGWPLAGTKALEAQVAVQNDALATLRADLGALQSALATRPDADQLAVLETELAAAKETLAEVPPQIADLGARLTRLEQLPMADGGISPAALGSLAGDLAALRSEVDAQKGSGVALAAEVEAAVRSANARLAEAEAKAAALKAEAEASTRTATTAAALAR
ncbi:MAG: hypothetical protein U1D35_06205, partial [Paracoccaceae bacterium]|nr:hypothetical protein [Paracoccaceae bacterium]